VGELLWQIACIVRMFTSKNVAREDKNAKNLAGAVSEEPEILQAYVAASKV